MSLEKKFKKLQKTSGIYTRHGKVGTQYWHGDIGVQVEPRGLRFIKRKQRKKRKKQKRR